MDYKTTPESWPGLAPNRSALACVQNKLGLSIGNSGGLRPRCLAGAEGAAGCQWSVPGGASGNRVTDAPPHGVVAGWGGQGRTALLRPSSWKHCHGWAHFGRRPNKRRARPLKFELSPWSHSSRAQSISRTTSEDMLTNTENNWGSFKARTITGRGVTSELERGWNCLLQDQEPHGKYWQREPPRQQKNHSFNRCDQNKEQRQG